MQSFASFCMKKDKKEAKVGKRKFLFSWCSCKQNSLYCHRNLQIYIYNGLQYEGQQTAPQDTTRYQRLHPAKENLVSHGVSAVSVAQYCVKTNSMSATTTYHPETFFSRLAPTITDLKVIWRTLLPSLDILESLLQVHCPGAGSGHPLLALAHYLKSVYQSKKSCITLICIIFIIKIKIPNVPFHNLSFCT